MLESPGAIPPPLATYLADIQPAYTAAPQFRAVRGVYNHGWLIGDETAIAPATQAEVDSMLEISRAQRIRRRTLSDPRRMTDSMRSRLA